MFIKILCSLMCICSISIAENISDNQAREQIKTEADKHNILARKKKFLEELEKRIKASNNAQTNEIDELVQNIKKASVVLSRIENIKVSKNKKEQKELINKINDFNQKMKKLEESCLNFMQSHKEDVKQENVLDPVNNNFQQETELNWERRVRFDEFKHPLKLENIEVSLDKKEEVLEQKQLPDAELSSSCMSQSDGIQTVIHDEKTILKR